MKNIKTKNINYVRVMRTLLILFPNLRNDKKPMNKVGQLFFMIMIRMIILIIILLLIIMTMMIIIITIIIIILIIITYEPICTRSR